MDRETALAYWCAALSMYVIAFVSGGQICNNCGVGSNCPIELNSTWPIALDTDCWERCQNTTDCQMATFDGTSFCKLYSCSLISQKLGGKTYRKTNNTECLNYEIYVHEGSEGKCQVIGTYSNASSTEDCLAMCLDTSLCHSITYDTTLSECRLHGVCSVIMEDAVGKTHVLRVCLDEQPPCIRNYTQKCVNCRAGLLCQMAFNQTLETKPLNIDTSVIGMDSDIKQIWYIANGSSFLYMQCSYVAQAVGDTVYRATCSQDCPTFELLTLPGHRGTCPEISSLSGGVSSEFCMDKCLDMDGCRGVTVDKALERCAFHNCTSYSIHPDSKFVARRCIGDDAGCLENSTVIQTCSGCSPGPDCPMFYLNESGYSLYKSCHDVKVTDNESVIAYYKRPVSECIRYQCSQVQRTFGHMLYRQSCNTDCPEFEISQLHDHAGTCDVIYSEEGGLTFHYCVEKCLDISGCRGTTFNETTGRCDYHNCTNYTASPGVTFMWKHCIDYDPPREHQQICVGCKKSLTCQRQTSHKSLPSWQECQTYFNNSELGAMHGYSSITNVCKLNNCTWLQQDQFMHHTAFRRSYSSDCPIFRLFNLVDYAGSCPVIGYTEGGVNLDYCVDKCLDMDRCRAVSLDLNKRKCLYHNCTERVQTSNYKFVKRVCMTYAELNPTENYIQTCKNCKNMCRAEISVQTNQQISSACNTTCNYCDNIIYDPLSEECRQYQCDRPYGLGQGTLLMRKTPNPECLDFELMPRVGSVPNCEAFDFDEGVNNKEFCLMRCFDLVGCLSVLIDITGKNCTYHSCTHYVPDNMGRLLVVKNCFTACASPVKQTCLNCQKGTLCQSSFSNSTTTTGDSCQAVCDAETSCEGAVYDSDSFECKLYQCSYVSQKYGSTFYRESCNNDCPIYEVYLLDGYAGTCDIIANMTEYFVVYPEICYQRCLDTAGCRGVTYELSKLECYYHNCDCNIQVTALNTTFWWRYCLDDVSDLTVLPQNISVSIGGLQMQNARADVYPTKANCKPTPIFIMSCQCSTGAFANLTNEEIVQQLVTNLTIDAESTSANARKYTSAEDNRQSAVTVGSVAVLLLISAPGAVIVMDFPNFIRTLRHIYRKIRMKKTNKERSILIGNTSFDTIESLRHYYAEDIVCKSDVQKEPHSERRLSLESIE